MLRDSSDILYHQPCDTCRRRKVKCDRNIPQCSRCLKYSYQCSYMDNLKRKGPKKGSKWNLTCTINPFFDSLFKGTDNDDEHQQVTDKSKSDSEQYQNDQQTEKGLGREEEAGGQLVLKKHINFKNFTKSSIDSILNALLSNSIIDSKCKVQISSTGKVKYCGDSPMALILTTYSLHHPSPSAMTSLFSKLCKPTDISSPIKLQFSNRIVQLGIKAYFKYFHPYTPIIDRRDFYLKFNNQPPLLILTVASIGIGYIPQYAKYKEPMSEQVSKLIKVNYLNPTLANLTSLILVAFYQHHNQKFSKGWFYLGIAARFASIMGLNQKSNNQAKIRIWWWLHILDKLYAFSMDRPWIQDTRQSNVKQAKVSQLDFVHPEDDKLGYEPSILFTNLLSELCHLQCLMVRKFKFTELAKYDDYQDLEKLCRITVDHMNLFYLKVCKKYTPYYDKSTSTSNHYEVNIKIIYYGTLIQLYQYFSGTTNTSLHNHYYNLCLEASIQLIQLTLSLEDNFFYCGITYRFYCLGTAIMFLIRSFKNKSSPEIFLLLRNGIDLLEKSKVYYDLAFEFANLTKIIAQVETIL